ncbi:MAG TPA: AraC family transcriptional regulator [Ruminiclostridium sp.]
MPKINLIGHSVCTKEWKLPLRTNQDYELIVLYQGEVTFFNNGIEYNLKAGDYLIIHPNEPHSAVTNQNNPCRFYYVHFTITSTVEMINDNFFSQEISDKIKSIGSENNRLYWVMPETFLQRIYYSQRMFLEDYTDEIFTLFEKALVERNKTSLNSQLMISTYLSQILILITRLVLEKTIKNIDYPMGGEVSRLVQKAVFYIHENYLNPLTVKEVCNHIGVSQQYLARLFQKNQGCSPIRYINLLRIRYAKDLMRNSSMSIKEIAYAIGFDNPHYFTRLFKNIEGIPPTTFIKGLESKSNE